MRHSIQKHCVFPVDLRSDQELSNNIILCTPHSIVKGNKNFDMDLYGQVELLLYFYEAIYCALLYNKLDPLASLNISYLDYIPSVICGSYLLIYSSSAEYWSMFSECR